MNGIESLVYELSEPRRLYLKKEFIDPNTIHANEIIAKTVYSAISPGTEVAAYCGMPALRDDVVAYPRVLGYCNVAEVIYKGSEVSKWEVGDFFLSMQSHRSHFKCKENDLLIKLAPGNLKSAAVTYLFHLGYHGILTGNIGAGHNVGIIGLGVLGYTSCIMSKIAGADVFALSNQISYSSKLEANQIHLFPKDLNTVMLINEKTNGIGLDVVINTSNTWEDWKLALNCVNKGGTIVNLGFPGRGESPPDFNPLSPQFLYMKNVTIKYLAPLNQKGLEIHEQRFNIERNLNYLLGLIENNSINPADIISSEISYKDLEEQYQLYESKKEHLFSTILKWG